MSYGTELILGFPYQDEKLFKYFCRNVFKNTKYENYNVLKLFQIFDKNEYDFVSACERVRKILIKKFSIFEKNLICAQRWCLLELNDEQLTCPNWLKEKLNKIVVIKDYALPMLSAPTHIGNRIFNIFTLDFHLNFYADEKLVDLIFGVSISGRYRPKFVDYEREYGTLNPIIFDTKLKKLMNIAKIYISEQIPVFKKAIWCVKEKYY